MRPARTNPKLRPGVTILEVVLAVVMLGLVAASLTGALSAIENMSARNKRMLAAHEIANRLILTYLDDPRTLPPTSRPVEYGPYRFMWDYSVDGFEMKLNETQKRTSNALPQALDRFDVLTVTVYAAEGDSPQPYPGEELATISRMYDIAAPRNPEAARTMGDIDRIGAVVNRITGGGEGRSRPSHRTGGTLRSVGGLR